MLRVLVTIVLPLLAPTALYLTGLAALRRLGRAGDRAARQQRPFRSAAAGRLCPAAMAGRAYRAGPYRAADGPMTALAPAGRIAPQPWMSEPATRTVLEALAAGGAAALFVGGAVRDALLGREIGDIDLATPA